MSRGKRLPPTRFPLPLRLAAALPVGTLFVGSGLVGFAPPAAAASDAPVLNFAPTSATVDPGQPAETLLTVTPGQADPLTERVCLGDLTVDNGFTAEELTEAEPLATAVVSGKPDPKATTVEVKAWLTYAVIPADRDCADYTGPYSSSTQTFTPFTVTVRQPEPTPTPTPTTPPPDPPTSSSPPPSSPPPSHTGGGGSPSSGGGDRDPDRGDREDSGGRGGSGDGRGGSTAPPHSPVTTRDDLGAPEGRGGIDDLGDLGDGPADIPELPDGALPGLEPPSGDDPLADLPTVEPGDDASDGTSEVAARESSPASAVTPAVLLLFLLLLLLFSTPLAPARRVRTGPTAYRGRRRRK
ncbi:hypothetical protein LG943_05160 [Streptomonospora sp. S1-112]|uniref:Uncharacterized protein n=1 Tax=Streptomonospora mangrovi TaxID=2883123 RepID=A0A9X3NIC2_9ACTN|nr:hypothetical protein [Streptomonospora mangrovi]MDA0563723.1 hypothetical protein [Streptomonospora mangrovi]